MPERYVHPRGVRMAAWMLATFALAACLVGPGPRERAFSLSGSYFFGLDTTSPFED